MMKLSEHPSFKSVDPSFINHLEQTISSLTGKTDIELIGSLMSIANEAKKRNITLTPDMQVAFMEFLKQKLPQSKKAKFDALINMMSSQLLQ